MPTALLVRKSAAYIVSIDIAAGYRGITCRDRDSFCSLHWATAAPSAKGLGAANLLIVACDTP